MTNAGPALMGIGYGVGEQRALQAAQSATNSPLLEQTIHGAKGLLVNVTSSEDLTLAEANEALLYIQSMCDEDEANIFFGTVIDPSMDGTVRVTVLATGFNPYSPEGRRVAEATYNTPQPEVKAAVVTPVGPVTPTQVSPAATVQRVEPKPLFNAGTAPASRANQFDASEVFDESDLDIPAFIREHKK
jgi:cell division protein FtsZ